MTVDAVLGNNKKSLQKKIKKKSWLIVKCQMPKQNIKLGTILWMILHFDIFG